MTRDDPVDRTRGTGQTVGLRFFPLWLGLGLLMVSLVVYLSLISIPPMKGMDFAFSDKVAHLCIYGVMAFWFGQIWRRGWTPCVSGLCLVLLGVVLEFLQDSTGYRTFEVADMVANTIGAAAGVLVSRTRLGNFIVVLEKAMRKPGR